MVRLSQIAHATESHSTAASRVDARTIVTFVGFRATDVARHGDSHCDRLLGAVVQAVDHQCAGCAEQMYVAGTMLLETYAVPPLLPSQVRAIGVTSYNRMLYLGVNADREAMSDLDVPPSLLRESLDELLEAAQ